MRNAFRVLTVGSLVALGAGTLGMGASTALAQSACIEQCRANGWAASQCSRYCETRYGEPGAKSGSRVYGYQARRGSCGAYHYSKGGRCVDARTTPATR